MATLDESFGIISAYGYALTKGFNGTEEEFAEMMAHVGDWYEEAEELAKSSNAVTAKSYAIGGTGTRDGEDTDNARYYADQASADSDSAEASATAAAKSAESLAVGLLFSVTNEGLLHIERKE